VYNQQHLGHKVEETLHLGAREHKELYRHCLLHDTDPGKHTPNYTASNDRLVSALRMGRDVEGSGSVVVSGQWDESETSPTRNHLMTMFGGLLLNFLGWG
jgi:hypothetical protein